VASQPGSTRSRCSERRARGAPSPPGSLNGRRAAKAADLREVAQLSRELATHEVVFVTSANLTESALDRNIELGLLLRDRSLAASVLSHFRGLIERNLLSPLPLA
jgi:hypothetical protein